MKDLRHAGDTDHTRVGFARTDAAGRYVVAGLPPGEYLVAVTCEPYPVTASDRAALQATRSRATLVTLGVGSAVERNLADRSASAPPTQNGPAMQLPDRSEPPRPVLERIPPPLSPASAKPPR